MNDENNPFAAMVANEAEQAWEGWDDETVRQQSPVRWKTLISADKTASHSMVLGVFELPPGETLLPHRHAEAEIYYILAGEGRMQLAEAVQTVGAGMAIFIPGHAEHAITNTAEQPLRVLYTFPRDSFADITYLFSE